MKNPMLLKNAYDAVKDDHYTLILFCTPDSRIRWWAKLFGHHHPIHHVSLLWYSVVAGEVIETELTHEGASHSPIYYPESLDDIEEVLLLPRYYRIHCYPYARMTWRSLLRSGVDHTFPPLTKLLARAILRVSGEDKPTPMTCSGYVLHSLTGTTDPRNLTIPPHTLKEILSHL